MMLDTGRALFFLPWTKLSFFSISSEKWWQKKKQTKSKEVKFLFAKVASLMCLGDWKNHSKQFKIRKNADGFLKYLNELQGPISRRLFTFQHCLRGTFFSFTGLSAHSRIYWICCRNVGKCVPNFGSRAEAEEGWVKHVCEGREEGLSTHWGKEQEKQQEKPKHGWQKECSFWGQNGVLFIPDFISVTTS